MTDLTQLLAQASGGNREAFDRVYGMLYPELLELAHAQRRRWQGNATLDTTVLVHEAYLKLAGSEGAAWEGRRHFFALAARVMRQVLVNYAEAQQAAKRGGGEAPVTLGAVDRGEVRLSGLVTEAETERVLALNQALIRLAEANPRQARIVECRFFAGFSIPETAESLGISEATVKREWQAASAWLRKEAQSPG